MKSKTTPGLKIIALNRKASFNYFFEDLLEAGLVLKGSEIKSIREGKVNIADSYAIEKDGELCMKGPYISDGFYKDDDSESFKNGWFYSGDIFKEENGYYFIIDRKKDIYKNSRGQTIAPQKIENLLVDL